MKRADAEKCAGNIEGYATGIRPNILAMWDKTEEWQRGPKAASTEPGGGNRWEEETDDDGNITEVQPVPNDPTGEAVVHPDRTNGIHVEFRKRLGRIEDDLRWLADINRIIGEGKRHKDADDDLGPEWCASCYRDRRYLEPVGGDYAELCRWCGDFRGVQRTLPPPELVRARHAGQRISAQMVDKALARQRVST